MLTNTQSAIAMPLPAKISRKRSHIALMVALSMGLVACGESDLTELHAEKIDAAVQAAAQAAAAENEPEIGPGNEDVATPVAVEGNPAPSDATVRAISTDDYDLVFFDEFNGTTLDASKWNTEMAWGPDLVINDESQYYVDSQSMPNAEFDPFTFDGDALVISANTTPASMTDTANNQAYVSGAITTLGKFDMAYGYVEARVDLPAGPGLWPAIWMLGTEFIDLKPQLFMMEYNGAKPNSLFHNYNYTDVDGNLRSPRQHEVVVEGASTEWQTVGVLWSPGELVYYVNGFPTFQVNGFSVASQPMYLILNMAVGGIWVDDPDASTQFPAEFKVDYVRVYQPK